LRTNALEQNARRGGSHLIERLANGGEARIVERGSLDVIETNDRNVAGDVETLIHEGANRSDGGDIVVAEKCSEIAAALDEFVSRLEAKFRRRDAKLELSHELRRYDQLEIAGYGHETAPAIVGIGTVAAPAHEGDFAVAELIEMTQCKLSGALLVEDHIGDPINLAMAGDDDSGENAEAFFEGSIDEDKALYRTIHEEAWVLFDEVRFAAVTCGEVEIALFNKVLFNSAENLHGVTVAEFGDKDADCESLALAQGSREEAWAVVEFGGSFNNAVAGLLRDGPDSGSVVENQRNCSGRKVEVFAEGTQTDGLAGLRRRSWFGSLGHALQF